MTTTASAPSLSADLVADGFRSGPPRHMHSECLMADLESYSSLECEACGHGRHRVHPYHRDREYRLVCVCRQCGRQTEV